MIGGFGDRGDVGVELKSARHILFRRSEQTLFHYHGLDDNEILITSI